MWVAISSCAATSGGKIWLSSLFKRNLFIDLFKTHYIHEEVWRRVNWGVGDLDDPDSCGGPSSRLPRKEQEYKTLGLCDFKFSPQFLYPPVRQLSKTVVFLLTYSRFEL